MDVFHARAAEAPGKDALVLLAEHGGQLHPERLTYGDLAGRVRALAARLRAHAAPGDRVLILHSSRRLFATAFLACLHARLVAVPAAPPGGRGHHDERIAGIIRDAAAGCVLTETAHAADVSQLLARTGFGQVTCLLTDTGVQPPDDQPATALSPGPAPDEIAYLQYTSGSTREPRGVMVTHGNLAATMEAIRGALGTGPASRFGGWLPLHHDMGLVGQLLHPLWLGVPTVMLTPRTFVRKPFHWLDTVSRYGLTVSGAPDFAYEMCLRRIGDPKIAALDLSRWRTAVNGGEPVNPATLTAFAERFAPAGLRPDALTPAYGLAEATLLVSAGGPASSAAQSTAPCGAPASAEVRIVDPGTGTELPDGRTGEIWVRGDSVAHGYWGRPLETAEAFDVRLGGRGGYLRTGDLGLLAEGQLHVTGRIKDVIVVAGRNLYPQDVERTVQQVSAVFGPATVFAVPGARERVVVVQELRARSHYDIDLASLAATVEARIGEEHEVRTGGLLFVRPGTVRRTTSGKVERSAMRGMFLRGELSPLHQRVDREVEQLLTAGARS
ncbi:fatty acyl-AMP ligase [Streptomyces ureilyticus]|uniref:Fatty acyl-AMP ligase n=1 Tax=Streptomyces ureilyticus TaxID=1775131 RepID=A0ABX0DUG1_9ACTN|nr:fatty acyl-AMP ligase [Streptomyces ureilyticus]NGO43913.1 fatty acyl-AMP ligase [Streptomyces ureilyticus]